MLLSMRDLRLCNPFAGYLLPPQPQHFSRPLQRSPSQLRGTGVFAATGGVCRLFLDPVMRLYQIKRAIRRTLRFTP
jgi:hypothetical protein